MRRYVGVKHLIELDKYISYDILSLWENKKYAVRRYFFLIKYKITLTDIILISIHFTVERGQIYLL